MIAPQELKIGNLVTINNSRAWPDLKDIPLTVIELSTEMDEYEKELFPKSKGTVTLKGDIETYNQFSQFVSPIELTEDWLKKFSFSNLIPNHWSNKIVLLKYNESFYEKMYGVEIKHVHQLQNCFNVFTGEELKIKES